MVFPALAFFKTPEGHENFLQRQRFAAQILRRMRLEFFNNCSLLPSARISTSRRFVSPFNAPDKSSCAGGWGEPRADFAGNGRARRPLPSSAIRGLAR